MKRFSQRGISPFLRWAGSKRQLLPVLSEYWLDSYERYIEPFAGSACLFFHLQPKKAVLGDINMELIRTYREIKYRLPAVIDSLRNMKNSKESYEMMREFDTSKWSSPHLAARFIFLNRFCFNGLYRTNSKGKFNVPYGGAKSGSVPSPDALRSCSHALKNAKLMPADFERVLETVRPGDFVYLDPPFSVHSRRVFKEYGALVFNENDVRRLRGWMEVLSEKRIPFLVSYAESDEADFLRRGFNTTRVYVRRNIAGFARNRSLSSEFLISSKIDSRNVRGPK